MGRHEKARGRPCLSGVFRIVRTIRRFARRKALLVRTIRWFRDWRIPTVPELPEVETIVADLRPHLVGRTITRCELAFPTIVRHPEPEEFIDAVVGMRIESVGRRGKYILIRFDNNVLLVVHLGMTGQLRLVDAVSPLAKHTHAVFFLENNMQLRYRDTRRFGRLLLGTQEALLSSKKMPQLGPEPIDPEFAAEELYRRLRKRRTALKAVLLDQGAIAGVGNIYADESLHRARLRPDRIARTVSKRSAVRLHESLRESLLVAIANRGSSVDTYRDAWGEIGGQQEKLLVYGRAGEPCFTCGRPLSSIRIAGRTTVFCRTCQH
ncbi:MAG: bifunctional DNA-formamidopyrimidine glycosylase/DNA-(apurinic or apyrimidinic site) lyase [Chloroflexi bacterium]|nr:MAG: bifunctional DNA-formamidopyrimidine glycosylase/DNA-(apurinic or apyrimidinic site) lyase [Chloroflexota bacterium]